jgi:ATP-dependent Zn protease
VRAEEATRAHLAQFSDADMAYHEAGHAVIHHLNGGTITRLSIDRSDARRGTRTAPQPPPDASATDDAKTKLEKRIATLVAGDAAGSIHGTPEVLVTAGSRVDHEQALWSAAEAGLSREDARAMIDGAWERAGEQLRQPDTWQLVETLAKELIQKRTLEAEQIAAILKR